MSIANGLAEILIASKGCGYSVDQAALEAYADKSGLGTPEGLSHMSNLIKIGAFAAAPDAAKCTLSRLAGRRAGLISPAK